MAPTSALVEYQSSNNAPMATDLRFLNSTYTKIPDEDKSTGFENLSHDEMMYSAGVCDEA